MRVYIFYTESLPVKSITFGYELENSLKIVNLVFLVWYFYSPELFCSHECKQCWLNLLYLLSTIYGIPKEMPSHVKKSSSKKLERNETIKNITKIKQTNKQTTGMVLINGRGSGNPQFFY